MDNRLTSIDNDMMSVVDILQNVIVSLGIEKLSKINSYENEEAKETLHEELTIEAFLEEQIIKVPSYKNVAIEDLLIEDAIDNDLLGILKVERSQ